MTGPNSQRHHPFETKHVNLPYEIHGLVSNPQNHKATLNPKNRNFLTKIHKEILKIHHPLHFQQSTQGQA